MSDETKKKVIAFYFREDISRCLPGQKDVIAKQPKYLIVDNLKYLYSQFKTDYPEIQIEFSTFCALRPKNCVLAGDPGTHISCVCETHQNIKLALAACSRTSTIPHYTEFFKSAVC